MPISPAFKRSAVALAAIAVAITACSKAPAAPAAEAPKAAEAAAAQPAAAPAEHADHETMMASSPAASPEAPPPAQQAAAQPTAAPASLRTAADFTLKDMDGKPHQLYALSDKSAVVVLMYMSGCPIVRKMTPDLDAITAEFKGKNIEFVAMNPNHDPADEVKTMVKEFGMKLPILVDADQKVAKQLGVQRNSEVVVIQPKTWKILYSGPLDDRLDFTSERAKPNHRYVADALNQMLAGKPVTVQPGEIKGCPISWG